MTRSVTVRWERGSEVEKINGVGKKEWGGKGGVRWRRSTGWERSGVGNRVVGKKEWGGKGGLFVSLLNV